MHSVVAMLVAAALAQSGWETLVDPQAGVQILRPAGWPVEVLPGEVLSVRAPPPLQGSVLVVPVSAPGATPKALWASLAAKLGGIVVKEAGTAALVQFTDPATPGVPRTALVAVAMTEGRGALAVVSAPSAEWDAARPALTAIASSFKLEAPKAAAAPPVPAVPLRFEPFREPKEQAFTGELPGDWKKELSIAIVPGTSPYVRASAVGRSADNLYAFVHYKLASFQVPVEDIASSGAGVQPYQPGAEVLEKYLFPAVAKRDPKSFSEWKITKRGGVQPLFAHASGVRFDGEAVEYTYRFKGELFQGRAFVTTYLLPGTPSATWFLYALHGFEGPSGREEAARPAAVRLLGSFAFEGRYAPQADLFWTLARDAALKALSPAEPAAPAAPAGTGTVAKRASPAPTNAIEAAVSLLKDAKDEAGKPIKVQIGVAGALSGVPALTGAQLGDLRVP